MRFLDVSVYSVPRNRGDLLVEEKMIALSCQFFLLKQNLVRSEARLTSTSQSLAGFYTLV